MAYDENLASRIRELLSGEPAVTERKMFGGLAFLVRGNTAIAASGNGGALVRCDPDDSDALVAKTKAESMVMRGREMRGWLRLPEDQLHTKRELAKWVGIATTYARTLPAK
jgi:TfoX/Sxy family transcriptional regulator of competence genes